MRGGVANFGSRNDAELHAHLLVGQRGGRETPLHHGKHPTTLALKFGKQKDGHIDYVKGANIAGFMKVAQAMLEQGVL